MLSHPLSDTFCFISRRVWDNGEAIGYLYREAPDNERDSGWRIFAGDESDEYANQPSNIAYVRLAEVAATDRSLLALLDYPPDCAFARNEHGAFVAEDFAPPED